MASARATLRRLWITLAVLLTLVGLYALLGFYGVPALVQSIAQKQVEKMGRHVSIGRVDFNPFTFEASIGDFKLTEADGSPLISFEDFAVEAEVWDSLRQRGAVLDYVRLKSPDIALIVEADGSINLAKLVPPSTEPPSPEPVKLPKIHIGALSIDAGRLGIEDRSRPKPFATALSPIQFSLSDFRTDPDTSDTQNNIVQLKAATKAGEELEWSGDFSVQPIGSKGRFAIRKLQAATIVSYLQDQLPVKLVSGVADIGGTYTLTLDPDLALDVKLPAITVANIAVDEKGAAASSQPPLSLTELGLHDLDFSLAKRELRMQRITLKNLNAQVRREADGSINLMRLMPPPSAPAEPTRPVLKEAPKPAQKAGAAWKVAVTSIDLTNAAVNAEDQTMQPATRIALRPIAVSVKGFSTDANKLGISADIGIEGKGHLHTQGDLQLQPLSTQLDLDLQDFDLAALQPYLENLTPVTLKSGLFGVKGKLAYVTKPQAPAAISFAGDLGVSNFHVLDGASKQELFQWRDLKLSGIDFQQGPDRLNIEQLLLIEPSASVAIAADGKINLTTAFAPASSSSAPSPATPVAVKGDAKKPAAAAKPLMPVKLKTIRIEEGHLNFADQSIQPNFSARIDALKGEVTGVSTEPNSRAKIHLQGQIDKFSPVAIDGEANLLSADQYTDIALSFRNIDLIRFNPYSGRFAGYNITKGKLSTELKYNIQKRVLAAQHHVIVDQLEFGDATGSKQAVPLPIKLAVALLKDRHGVIDLELPVNGSLDDPAFKIGPIIGKTLVNLLTKAVTAPFSALARLFGGNGEELAYVDFEAGAPRISLSEAEKVEKLATALMERPELKLDIPLTYSDQLDKQAMAEMALQQRILAQTDQKPAESAEKAIENRLKVLEKLHGEIRQTSPKYPPAAAGDNKAYIQAHIAYLQQTLAAALAPDTAALEQLATARADNVQALLLAHPEIKPERLYLTARRTSGVNQDGAARMELQLQ